MIKQFSIHGLHNRQNIDLRFDSQCKILLSENGVGKTTVLNALNAVLTQDLERLRNIEFESIWISFQGHSSELLGIAKDQLQFNWDSRAYEYFKKKLDGDSFRYLIDLIMSGVQKSEIVSAVRKRNIVINSMALSDLIDEKISLREKMKEVHFFHQIKEKFKDSVLYLPTYRRIEENLEGLGAKDGLFDNKFINFGLSDVSARMKVLREDILQFSNTSFNSVSGDLLTKLINNTPTSGETREIISKHTDIIPLILNRMGSSLSQSDKEKIISSATSGAIFDRENEAIAYFLARLVDAYQKQRKLDESLKKYADVCKDYFKNKEVVYDEARIKVDFFTKDTLEPIEIDHLSSGEKQIASLFAKIHLYSDRNLAILFDEPELSLSIEWQERLLKDIMDSGRCSFLLAMTHSPFIIKNVVEHTSDMSNYISKSKE